MYDLRSRRVGPAGRSDPTNLIAKSKNFVASALQQAKALLSPAYAVA